MIKKTLLNALLATVVLWSVSASARMAPPAPPTENPHPPVTAEDKKRVAFAEQVVALLLKKDLPTSLAAPLSTQPPAGFSDKNLVCLQDAACYGKDAAFVGELLRLRETYGKAVETQYAHVIPWSFDKFKAGASAEPPLATTHKDMAPDAEPNAGMAEPMPAPQLKADEYMMHVYVRFEKAGVWHHLDVIVTEDKAGNLSLRHFFVMPMYSQMPPGVVC